MERLVGEMRCLSVSTGCVVKPGQSPCRPTVRWVTDPVTGKRHLLKKVVLNEINLNRLNLVDGGGGDTVYLKRFFKKSG